MRVGEQLVEDLGAEVVGEGAAQADALHGLADVGHGEADAAGEGDGEQRPDQALPAVGGDEQGVGAAEVEARDEQEAGDAGERTQAQGRGEQERDDEPGDEANEGVVDR